MSRREAIGAVLASVVVLAGAGCDSGSDSASAPDDASTTSVTGTTTGETTGDMTGTSADGTPETTGDPTDAPPAGGTSSTPSETTSTTPSEPRYALGTTRRCLVRAGMQVGPVGDTDARLQALGDLAQRTSLEIRRGEDLVGFAIGDVELLPELLAVPNDPYQIETRGNVLLMFKPGSRDLAARVGNCLRT